MRATISITFCFALSEVYSDIGGGDKQMFAASQALNYVREQFIKMGEQFTIHNYGCDGNFIDFLIRNSNLEISSFKIINSNEESLIELSESAVLIFNSVNDLEDFNEKVKLTNVLPAALRYFVYIKSGSLVNLSKLSDTQILQYQYFLINVEGSIKMMTFVWYTPNKCNSVQLIEVNNFDKSLMKWEKPNFTISKFRNFYGCQVVFGVFPDNPAFSYDQMDNGTIYYWGYNYQMIKGLTNILNYTFRLNPFLEDEGIFYFDNLTVDYLVRIAPIHVFVKNHHGYFLTQPYVFLNNLIAVPPGEPYTEYEKLLLPFDYDTWIVIACSFLVAFAVIFGINFMKLEVRNFVFGLNVTTPSLNVAAHFFGISQTILPGRNFARFLLTMFIIYTLIIRTAWQGKMFEFMQKNVTKQQVQSIEEMIEKNYTFYMLKGFNEFHHNTDLGQR